MSHFCVIVCDTMEESIESQLEPYGQDSEEYFEKDIEIDAVDIKEKSLECLKGIADNIKRYKDKPQPLSEGEAGQLKWLEDRLVEFTKLRDNGDYSEIIKLDYGYEIDENGDAYSEYNPSSKWDWYSEGGRWSGYFKLKPNHKDDPVINGHFSQTDEDKQKMRNNLLTDVAVVKEIDWEAMRADNIKQAEGWWADYESADEKDKQNAGWKWDIYKTDTKDTYIARKASIAPFAVLIDGEWSERGSMGWFGMVSDEDDKWEEQFDALVVKLQKEHPLMELTIVDCHI